MRFTSERGALVIHGTCASKCACFSTREWPVALPLPIASLEPCSGTTCTLVVVANTVLGCEWGCGVLYATAEWRGFERLCATHAQQWVCFTN